MPTLKKPRAFETAFTKYTATEVIGQGGSGTVFKATDDRGETVAIKLLDASKATTEKRKRFKNELLFGERSNHPNVIKVIDHGVDESAPFYVMPYYAQSLRNLIDKGINADEVLPMFKDILDGVEAALLRERLFP